MRDIDSKTRATAADAANASSMLDFPIWSALTSVQSEIALRAPNACRYPHDIAPFAAIREGSEGGFESLWRMIPPGDQVAFFTIVRPLAPPEFEIRLESSCHQMVAWKGDLGPGCAYATGLDRQDVPEMLALVALTKPGPFGPRTIELGEYIGVRIGGKLVAMVGERMKFNGFVEISAVCVHPDHRGTGLAEALTSELMRRIRNRGAVPFLHVFTHNEAAIRLYEKLGFERRQQFHVTALGRPAIAGSGE